MDESWKNMEAELDQYFAELETNQKQMEEILNEQQICLTDPDPAELNQLHDRGAAVLETFRTLIDRRGALLKQAELLGHGASSLEELARVIGGADSQQSKTARRLKFQSGELDRMNQSQWVTCQKSLLHCRHLVELIAHGGKKPLQTGTGRPHTSGGVILDASV